jgi:hypothetical protein
MAFWQVLIIILFLFAAAAGGFFMGWMARGSVWEPIPIADNFEELKELITGGKKKEEDEGPRSFYD